MAIIINTKLGEHRGKKRVWIEGVKLLREGYEPGMKFDVESKDHALVLRVREEGSYTVSRRERNGNVLPVIDLTTREIAEMFDGVEVLRVLIKKGSIVITSHQQQGKIQERESRLVSRLTSGEPLKVCSLFHGGGILDKAIHRGLKMSGVESSIAVAVEIEQKYLDSSLLNNPELWSEESIVIESPIQLVNLDRNSTQVDLICAGIPCTGSSLAGRSKKKLKYAESDTKAGALFFHFLQFVATLNPSVVLVENVANYADTSSMEVIRSVLDSLGYSIQERILDGNEFGALEKRKRLCVVAMSKGLQTNFILDQVRPVKEKEDCLQDILEDVPLDSERWKPFDYLREKEIRDKEAGKGFRRQLLTGAEAYCGTVTADYFKCRSTDPYIVHPLDDSLSRLLTPQEHCAVKGTPQEVIAGLSDTVAHQILGQSVVFPMFEAVSYGLGCSLMDSVTSSKIAA